jgi:hypothetical protein
VLIDCQLPDDKCGFQPGVGAHCVPEDATNDDNCNNGLYCNTGVSPAVCAPALGSGATCTYAKQCRSQNCAGGHCTAPCVPP